MTICTAGVLQKETGENLNDVGKITETHQEFTQARGVPHFFNKAQKFFISILVSKENIHILPL